jgi:hypothetical protein
MSDGVFSGTVTLTVPNTVRLTANWAALSGTSGTILVKPLGLTQTASPAPSGPGPAASYPTDSSLATPVITSTRATDNAVIVTFSDTNPAQTTYLAFAWDRDSHVGPAKIELATGTRAFYIIGLNNVPLRPGATYDIQLFARGASGGLSSSPATTAATLTAPTIRVGNPATGAVSTPSASWAVAALDNDGNGIFDGVRGSGGAYPYYPGTSGTQSVARAGNGFDSLNGTRANVILSYFFDEGGAPRFAAFHLFIDSTNRFTPVSVLYGDAVPDVPGKLVWVGPVG